MRLEDHSHEHEPTWLHTHQHDPNPAPPEEDVSLHLQTPDGKRIQISPADLKEYPQTTVEDCYIVSTGHGTSGPFTFGGVRLRDLLNAHLSPAQPLRYVDVVSADGFGNRVYATELQQEATPPVLLAIMLDGHPMPRPQGLVRMIVPSETDDALRQVKWIKQITIY